MNTLQPQPTPALLHRFIAMGLALIVFGLGLMSVSPGLHDRIHQTACHENDAHSDERGDLPASDANHSCVIVSYASGVTFAIEIVAPSALPASRHLAQIIASELIRIISPAHLLPEGRGPPVSLS